MKRTQTPSLTTRVLRRAAVGTVLMGTVALATPLAAGADVIASSAPSITAVSGSAGDLTVTWTDNAPDATSLDVILYDQSGNVVVDDNLASTATTDTLNNVADGGGYTISVVANTPSGDLSSDSTAPFDVTGGTYVLDNAPSIQTVGATAGNVTVTWTNDAADASSLDVTLYDQNGNVVQEDTLSASATRDTFANVPDGTGYYAVVTAITPGGDLSSDASGAFDLAGGAYSNDAAPTLVSLDASNGVITVTWSSNASDVTGYDVMVTDGNGTQIADDSLGAGATSDSVPAVADGTGYEISIVAHTPIGDFTTPTGSIDISGGTIAHIPVDPIPVVLGTGTVVDPGTVSVTPISNGDGGWTISWPEVTNANSSGWYEVTTDQGDVCTVDSDGVAGDTATCDLSAHTDGSTEITGLTVTYYPMHLIEYDLAGAVAPTAVATAANGSGSSTVTPVRFDKVATPRNLERHTVALGHVTSPAAATPWALGAVMVGGVAVLLSGAIALLRRRRVL